MLDSQKSMSLKLASKSQTLENLAKVITSAKILPQVNFLANEYIKDNKVILNTCMNAFSSDVIVRSSLLA